MKLKKKVKLFLVIILIVIALIVGLIIHNKVTNNEVKETKIVNEIEEYGYQLKDSKTKRYKKMFEELKEILTAKEVDEEAYVKKISEMFIYDFYSLNDKTAKTDIGGVDFIYSASAENFLEKAQDTYYKYVESNIYNNRKQTLPIVDEITIESVEKTEFAYSNKTDPEAYEVSVTWDYTNNKFSDYQKKAKLIFAHNGKKLVLVELQ